MPAPLVTALGYFLAPRMVGGAADLAAQARQTSLIREGIDQGQSDDAIMARIQGDPYLNALGMVPRQSGFENIIDAARALYNANTMPFGSEVVSPEARTIDELLSGRGFNAPDVTPGAYVERNGQFLTPMDDFLRYGGRDADINRHYQAQSYGQTDQPATEVRFDKPPGGADGGLAALIRRRRA